MYQALYLPSTLSYAGRLSHRLFCQRGVPLERHLVVGFSGDLIVLVFIFTLRLWCAKWNCITMNQVLSSSKTKRLSWKYWALSDIIHVENTKKAHCMYSVRYQSALSSKSSYTICQKYSSYWAPKERPSKWFRFTPTSS